MDNFNYKKYLAEGKLLKEEKEVEYYPKTFIDIATSYMKKHHGGSKLGKTSNKQLEILGQKIVDQKYDGDSRKAYQELVGINEKVEVNEGVWKIGNPDDVNNFIEHTTEMKRDYWNVVGSDEVMDGLDQAIKGAEKLLHTALNPLRGGGSYNKEK